MDVLLVRSSATSWMLRPDLVDDELQSVSTPCLLGCPISSGMSDGESKFSVLINAWRRCACYLRWRGQEYRGILE